MISVRETIIKISLNCIRNFRILSFKMIHLLLDENDIKFHLDC